MSDVQGLDEHVAGIRFAGHSETTIRGRVGCVARFGAFIGAEPLGATREDVLTFLSRPNLTPESRRCYRAHLRGFFTWAFEEGLIDEDPTAKIPPVRVPRTVPRPISDERLALALAEAPLRMRAWLRLMAYAGLRSLEVAALEPRDVELDPVPILRLRVTKGGGEATVPAHPAVLEALAPLQVKNGRWWTSSANTVSRDVNLHLRSLGIPDTAHSLRHAAGTAWYAASGFDIVATQRLLRHASVATTQRYADISPERPQEVSSRIRLVG